MGGDLGRVGRGQPPLTVPMVLDPLPPGVTTGVRPGGGGVEPRAFRAALHAAVRAAGGRVLAVGGVRSCANYGHAVVEHAGRRLAVLVNLAYPWVAFSDTPDELYLSRRYVDAPELAAALLDQGFRAVPLDVLTASPLDLAFGGLATAEAANARYWVERVRLPQAGDVLFNDWD